MLISFDHQVAAELDRIGIVVKGVQNKRIVRRVRDDHHAVKVFCCRAHHRRSADIDVLDDLFKIVRTLDRRFERVEVDTDKIDRLDTKLFGLVKVRLLITAVKDPAVNERVQCLDTAFKTFRELGDLVNLDCRHICFFEHLEGSACRNNLKIMGYKRLCELYDITFITDT